MTTHSIVHSPFDQDQMARIREWQDYPWTHDLTCNGAPARLPHAAVPMSVLPMGLRCPVCGGWQRWVPACCLVIPPNPATQFRGSTLGAEPRPDPTRPSPRKRLRIILGLTAALSATIVWAMWP